MGFFAYDSFCMHMGGHADGINWGGRGEAARDRSSLVGGSVGGRKKAVGGRKKGVCGLSWGAPPRRADIDTRLTDVGRDGEEQLESEAESEGAGGEAGEEGEDGRENE